MLLIFIGISLCVLSRKENEPPPIFPEQVFEMDLEESPEDVSVSAHHLYISISGIILMYMDATLFFMAIIKVYT